MPPTPKAELSKRQQKAAKQKKMLLLLVPVLAVLLIIQGPKLLKAGGGSSDETVAATTGAADTGAAPADPADTSAAAPAEPAATTEALPTAPAGPVELVDSDVPPAADPGQLIAFDRFAGKDPFEQQVVPPRGDESTSGSGGKGDGTKPGDGDGTAQDLPNAAQLVVNGALESVKIGGNFPAPDPTFRLVSIDGDSQLVRIGLVSGAFSTGASTLELEVGEKLTLVSQPDGIRYEIELKKLTTDSSDSSDSSSAGDSSG